MLDKERNFIKLKKRRIKTPRQRGEKDQLGRRSVFRIEAQLLWPYKKTKNVYGLGNFIDLIKGEITLHGDEANGKAC